MRFKKARLGQRLVDTPPTGFFRRAHVVFGGTGAVGGTVVLRMLDLLEEMIAYHRPAPEDVPVLVATGRSGEERRYFTRRLFRFEESRFGREGLPERLWSGYLTIGGVFVDVESLEVSPLPALARISEAPRGLQDGLVRRNLEEAGVPLGGDGVAELHRLVRGARPFSRFLESYRSKALGDGDGRIASVIVGIPLPSLVAYHGHELRLAARVLVGLTPEVVEELKRDFEAAIRRDLEHVRDRLADEVLIAHTTSVGGMYDEDGDGRRTIRLGFSHSARDANLIEKQRSAERLAEAYAAAGMKVFVTAAAIGIDEVRIREDVPLQREISRQLLAAPREPYPGARQRHGLEAEESVEAGFRVPIRQKVRVLPPITLPLDDPGAGELHFASRSRDAGELLRPTYALRSGENGIFTPANAEALYRVMRVASASELAIVLARVAMFGDDPVSPFFRDNLCYYTETDNSRQVFDFLAQPALVQTQLSGLEPLALQDLGSAKHQAELHTSGLLVLLHRLRTLDIDAIPPYVDLDRFDPRSFFIDHSRPLTFEDIDGWTLETLSRDLAVLVAAEAPEDLEELAPLRPHPQEALFDQKRAARVRVLAEVLRAVWAIPSLGTPIVFERDGRSWLRTGFYLAPLETLMLDCATLPRWLEERHRATGNPCSRAELRDYQLSVAGFLDLRPHAIVSLAKSDEEDLRGKVLRVESEEELATVLADRDRLPPYAFFATCGLIGVLHRMRRLGSLLREAMVELGTLHEFRWQMPRDENGHLVVLPGAVEALRMVAEGLEKATGTERLDGVWGYRRPALPDRRDAIRGG